MWQRAEQIAAEELWRTHERRRERLVAFARRRLRDQLRQRGASQRDVEMAGEVLDPEALTIGFARRFATYKRATLLFRDPDRLAQIVNDPDQPVQIIFAGKAHPRDNPGKDLICQIVGHSSEERFRRRIVFLENYDMATARYLVQGCDVWLNTPRRPREASGTSGMKAAANGVLNLSILDGWWDEAYQTALGWAIGRRETYADQDYQDGVESEALYSLLERDVVPAFYDRGRDGLPRQWISRMKAAIGGLCHVYNTHRMIGEYAQRLYMPAAVQYLRLSENDATKAKDLARWRARIRREWPAVSVAGVESEGLTDTTVRGQMKIRARVQMGSLTPADVLVQLYLGRVDSRGSFSEAEAIEMCPVGQIERGSHLFEATAVPTESGLHGYTFRILPRHEELVSPFLPGLITWAGES